MHQSPKCVYALIIYSSTVTPECVQLLCASSVVISFIFEIFFFRVKARQVIQL